jgi:hypothetical protein
MASSMMPVALADDDVYTLTPAAVLAEHAAAVEAAVVARSALQPMRRMSPADQGSPVVRK